MEVFNADSPQYPKMYAKRGADKAKEMVSSGAQLIYATAMYHAIKGSTGDVPIVDAAFLSPIIMGNAKKLNGKLYCTGNGTGTYLSYPFEEIVRFVSESMPEAKKIAYVYNPKSPVSRPIGEIEAAAKKVGLSVVGCPFIDSAGVMKAMEATKAAPVAFLTNDVNISGMQEKKAIQFAIENKIPVITGNIPSVENGSLAGIQWDWNRAGEMCAQKADAIMKGKKAKEIPIEMPDVYTLAINSKTAEAFKVAVPFEWLQAATKVIE
jgi:putative ABC transport system substrate-binding protein